MLSLNKIMNIYIDITSISYHDDGAGIHRFLKAIIYYFPKICNSNYICHFIRYSNDNGAYADIAFVNGSWKETSVTDFKKDSLFFKADLNPFTYESSLYQRLKTLDIKIVVICYDLTYILFPEFFVHINHSKILTQNLKNDIKYADAIICISSAVENELIVYARKPELVTGHFHLGADLFQIKNFVEHKKSSDTIKFLSVSTVEPRKGYFELVKAFDKVLARGFDASLTIVGKDGWKNDKDKNAILNSPYYNKRLFWNNHCDDTQLKKYYQSSDCFVFASYYEGFGLGLVEAAHYGMPLILRDLPVFREIAHDQAVYFDSYGKTLEEQLIYCIKNHKQLPDSKNIKLLTWEESIRQLYAEIQRIFSLN